MPNYYRITDPTDVRDLGDQIAVWTAAGNSKANDWMEQPAPISADAVWTADAEWVVPAAPTYTAEQWVAQYLSTTQLLALSDLRLSLVLASQPLGPEMQSIRDWTTNLMIAWAADPTPRHDWPACPTTYEAASSEAVSALTPDS